jgi:hypothetical protein
MTTRATTEDELARAIKGGQQRRTQEQRAAGVRYDPHRDAIEIDLFNGASIRLPRSLVDEFRDVMPADMSRIRVSPAGYGIELPDYDINISVHGLLSALTPTQGMAAALGKLGGSSRSDAKRASARANGAKGGRPRKIPSIA